MRHLYFIINTIILIFLLWVLNSSSAGSWLMSSIKGKETFVPPLGKLLSPSTGFWKNAESKNGPQLNNIRHSSLSAEVEIVYDKRLVPHIFAKSDNDAFFAQGYVTAALRLWQMEFQTHAVAGRLAEFLGTSEERRKLLTEIDIENRKSGLAKSAKESVELWKKDKKAYAHLQSYADGVNAYINSLSYDELPIEYKLLDYKPEQWSVYKSALLLKAMAKDLVSKDLDFEMTNAYKYFGREKFQKLYPEYFPEQSPIILDSAAYYFQADIVSDTVVSPYLGESEQYFTSVENQIPKGIGSNNWAIGPKKSASGNPILCNDPHLNLSLPSIWFEIQMVSPNFNAYGASLPGAPGVISGFNNDIAWGVTNVSHDVKDWYIINWVDASKKEYYFDGKKMKSIIIYDTIKVRNKANYIVPILYTHMGPVAKSSNGKDFALRWIANDPGYEPLTFYKLMQAKNYEDYKNAITNFSCPAQNIVFACNNGDIALWTQGKLPIRKESQGKFVMDGSVSFNQYEGFIPQDHIPHEYNPKKGFVGSANQHSVRPDYPYKTYGYFEEYRGRFLNAQLFSAKSASMDDMKNLQNSNFGQKAADFLPLLLKYIKRGNLNKEELEILALFKKWDYQYDAELIAPTVFEDWYYNFNEAIYDEISEAKSKGINMVFPDEWHLLGILKRDTAHFIVDNLKTEKKEDISEIVTQSFKKTYKTLPRKNSKVLSWADMKSTAIMHLARIPEFSIFNIPVSGTYHALNAVSNRYDYKASRSENKTMHKNGPSSGPSWKMLVELGDSPSAFTIYPGGQSGNPGSFYYNDMVTDWADGKYYSSLFLKKADEKSDQIIAKQKIRK